MLRERKKKKRTRKNYSLPKSADSKAWGIAQNNSKQNQHKDAVCRPGSHEETFSSVQFSCSVVFDSATPWTASCQASLSINSNSRSLLKLMSVESVMPSNHLILCRPLLLSPSIFPSVRVFSNESAVCIRWPKDWSFSFSISPSHEYSGLISFRMDFLDLLTVQGTLKSLLQHHSLKHQSFGAQLSLQSKSHIHT